MLGTLGGMVMARGNAPTERQLVAVAAPGRDETVLVVGPGPGIGLAAAAERAARVVGVDPSPAMLARCRRRCADAVAAGVVALRAGTAEVTGQDDASVDVVLSVNNVQLWDDRPAAFTELFRVLRPGGRILLSAHEKWLPVPRHALAAEMEAAGFTGLQTWTWEPPGMAATRAAQVRAYRPERTSGDAG